MKTPKNFMSEAAKGPELFNKSTFPLLSSDFEDENIEVKDFLEHKKPKTDEELGFYLAGLFASDGSFSTRILEICFHINDIHLAYYLKKRLGFGSVRKVKDKNCAKYIITNSEGIKKVLNLVNGKFYSDYKINYMIKHNYEEKYGIKILPPIDPIKYPIDKNHFLAGFADGDGNFSIFLKNSKTHKTGKNVVLTFRLTQKEKTILYIVKEVFEGNVCTSKTEDISIYSSTSFKVLPNIINYFDNYSLLSTKLINYIKWRKAAKLISNKEHLTEDGLKKLTSCKKIKDNMNDKLFK